MRNAERLEVILRMANDKKFENEVVELLEKVEKEYPKEAELISRWEHEEKIKEEAEKLANEIRENVVDKDTDMSLEDLRKEMKKYNFKELEHDVEEKNIKFIRSDREIVVEMEYELKIVYLEYEFPYINDDEMFPYIYDEEQQKEILAKVEKYKDKIAVEKVEAY